MTRIDDDLLLLLECPVAHVPLVCVGDWLYATDRDTRRKYACVAGVPDLRVERSGVASLEEYDRVMAAVVSSAADKLDGTK